MAGKGEELNQRVWKLFANLGFQTKPNWNDPLEEEIDIAPGKKRTLDLSAIDTALGVKIIGWAKARRRLTESITTHLHDYNLLRDKAQAQGVVFIATEKDFTDDDRNYANQVGIQIWGVEELEYYETLADTIGHYAKYELIHSLGIETREEKHIFNVLALNIRQPFADSSIDLFLFSVPPEFLLRTAVVFRKAAGKKDAYQRILQKKRLAPIRAFVTSENALLPPNIIVHFGQDVSWEPIDVPARTSSGKPITLTREHDYRLVLLSIPKKFASLELIDGQHRLFGFAHAEPASRDRFDLVVLGIAKLSSKRRTETFVAINDKARRMDANLVTYLKYDPEETECQGDHELMAIKVVVELNKVQPFHKAIRLLDVGKHRITLKGFAGYDLKGLLGTKGLLRKYYQNRSTEYVRALRIYFGVLKSMFPSQWRNPDEYIIFTNRGISAFLKLLKSILRTTQIPLTEDSVRKYLAPIRSSWPDHRWRTKKLASSYVGSQGWKDFHRDLVASIRKKYKSFRA